MKVVYDNKSADYVYPLSKKDLNKIKSIISSMVMERIRELNFGCNLKTMQEGRIVQRGESFTIRINFCLKDNASQLLSEDHRYIKEIKRFGGEINYSQRAIKWRMENAKLYAAYLIFHEIAHIVYSDQYKNGRIIGSGSRFEEEWCHNYSLDMIKHLHFENE
jgi:hypothetical protein